MAICKTGYFDRKGNFFKNARDATVSDLASLLGQVGEGESLAPGIASKILERRAEIEQLFAEHDAMMEAEILLANASQLTDNIAKLQGRPAG
ncbi:hypothetical protein [Erythrobacter sp.]|uniref:hypothetical protein n=1 Tax=Erythrobacter sp. TaxID=1042 RepID=UPI0025F5D9A7|nr:hypothetical protein [Erythrobacter sp.]